MSAEGRTPDATYAAIDELNQQIATLVRRARRYGNDHARQLDPSLSSTSYQIVVFLLRNGPHRAQHLVEIFNLDKAAVSRHLQQLDDLGLIDRRSDPDDRRATLVEVSEAAKARITEIHQQRRHELQEVMSNWPLARVQELASLLADYNRTLDV